PKRVEGAIQDSLQRGRDGELDDRDLLERLRRTLLLDRPGRVQHHQARVVDLRPALRHPLLHQLTRPQKIPGRQLTGDRTLAHDVEGALAYADPAHAVMNASGPEPRLR